jgi:hypothetical protein
MKLSCELEKGGEEESGRLRTRAIDAMQDDTPDKRRQQP